jgi:arsenite transporter
MDLASSAMETAPDGDPQTGELLERYLTLWVGLCMLAGLVVGRGAPELVRALRGMEFGRGSHVNVPIAVLIWLMIIPMMIKVDFRAILNVRRKPRGVLATLFANWLVKPFSMALIGWIFFRHIFYAWISPADADQYIAGVIIPGALSGERGLFADGAVPGSAAFRDLVRAAVSA